MSEKIVGHKTLIDDQGKRRHAPLYESEASAILKQIEENDKKRAELMPDEKAARRMLFEAYQRLKELGWNDACYCPKNGELVNFIEIGSSGIHVGHYEGEWPTGSYWIHSCGDLCPSHPVLFKPVNNLNTENGAVEK